MLSSIVFFFFLSFSFYYNPPEPSQLPKQISNFSFSLKFTAPPRSSFVVQQTNRNGDAPKCMVQILPHREHSMPVICKLITTCKYRFNCVLSYLLYLSHCLFLKVTPYFFLPELIFFFNFMAHPCVFTPSEMLLKDRQRVLCAGFLDC